MGSLDPHTSKNVDMNSRNPRNNERSAQQSVCEPLCSACCCSAVSNAVQTLSQDLRAVRATTDGENGVQLRRRDPISVYSSFTAVFQHTHAG